MEIHRERREGGRREEGGVIFIPFNAFESDLYTSVSGDPDGSLGRTLEHNKREVSQHQEQEIKGGKNRLKT